MGERERRSRVMVERWLGEGDVVDGGLQIRA